MAKKKSKKKVAPVVSETPVIDAVLVEEETEDTRVADVQKLGDAILAYDLGDMEPRLSKSMQKLVLEIGRVAKRLAKALEVQAKQTAKLKAQKAAYLAKAEATGV